MEPPTHLFVILLSTLLQLLPFQGGPQQIDCFQRFDPVDGRTAVELATTRQQALHKKSDSLKHELRNFSFMREDNNTKHDHNRLARIPRFAMIIDDNDNERKIEEAESFEETGGEESSLLSQQSSTTSINTIPQTIPPQFRPPNQAPAFSTLSQHQQAPTTTLHLQNKHHQGK